MGLLWLEKRDFQGANLTAMLSMHAGAGLADGARRPE
jgi:hypothetical protein